MLVPQPLPWTALGNREIADASGNVVQYTLENLGQICLAVNSHDAMVAALEKVEAWLAGSPDGDPGMRLAVSAALGKIGIAALVTKIEALAAPSAEADRAIARELKIPEAQYTTSMDAALHLVPPGWAYTVSSSQVWREVDHTGSPIATALANIEMTKGGAKTIRTSHASMVIALAAAAVATRGVEP
jgi:hypothetical protein